MEIICDKCFGQGEFVDCSEDRVDGVEIIKCKNCNGTGKINLAKCDWCGELYSNLFCCPRCGQQDCSEEW